MRNHVKIVNDLVITALISLIPMYSVICQTDEFTLLGTMEGVLVDSLAEWPAWPIPVNVGDINGDGYPDIAVGDPNLETVLIYFGGQELDTNHDMILTYEESSLTFGSSLCGGDINGDGSSDLIIGAFGAYGLNFLAGQVRIYYGGTTFDSIPDVILVGNLYRGFFGEQVRSGGDLNGDGWQDLVVYEPDDYYLRGHIYVFHGGPSFDTTPDEMIVGEFLRPITDQIEIIRDINGDGYDEMIYTTWGTEDGDLDKLWLVYGGDSLDVSTARIFEEDSLHDEDSFGRHIIGVEDYDGDAICDILIEGGGLVLFSGATFDTLYYQNNYTYHGLAQTDLNNDGLSDIIMGYRDTVSVIFGGSPRSIPPVARIILETEFNDFGKPIATGDFNQDGYPEVVIGSGSNYTRGISYLYNYGDPTADIETKPDQQPLAHVVVQNYPNPFNPSTTIEYNIPENLDVSLMIYDIAGREVQTLVSRLQGQGNHEVSWDGTSRMGEQVSGGMYFARLRAGEFSSVAKMVYLR